MTDIIISTAVSAESKHENSFDYVEKTVKDNIGLAVSCHRDFMTATLNQQGWEDMFSAAMEGLWKAARKYDPAQGSAFSTYATACIKNQMRSCSRSLRRWYGGVSLDAEYGEGLTLLDCQEDEATPSPLEVLVEAESYNRLPRALESLDPEDRRLLERFYGLGCKSVKLYDLAREAGVTSARMSQRRKQAEQRLLAAYLSLEDCPLPAAA